MARQDGKGRTETHPTHPRASSRAPQAAAGGYTIGIRREGASVEITLTTDTEYASIELYDRLVQSVEKGFLRLELKLPRS